MSSKLSILEQRYAVAREQRVLASLEHGRDSAQFKKRDTQCQEMLAKIEREKTK